MEFGNYGWGQKVLLKRNDVTINFRTAPATTNYGVFNIGDGLFDGITTGKFVGSSSGTQLAINTSSSFTGNLLDLQVAGVSKLLVSSTGQITGDVGSSNVESLTISGTPGGTNNVRLAFYNNSPGNSKTQFTFGGTLDAHRWAFGNDLNANNSQNFFLYDAATNNNRLVIDASGNFTIGGGIGAVAPTALATLDVRTSASSTIGAVIRGASGQSVNLQEWQTNTPTTVASMSPSGGLILNGKLTVQGSSGFDYFRLANSDPGFPSVVFNNNLVFTGPLYFQIADDGGGLGASSGTQDYVRITPTIEQSGTASYTALKVNVTENALGGTLNYLADFQLGSVSKASIDTTGKILSRGISMPDDLLAMAWMEVAI